MVGLSPEDYELAVEECMTSQGIHEIHGLQQLFTKRDRRGYFPLVMAKIVDGFLITGSEEAIKCFHVAIAKGLDMGRYLIAQDLVFNRLHIHQDTDSTVQISMEEYLQKIQPIVVPYHRKKGIDRNRCSDM